MRKSLKFRRAGMNSQLFFINYRRGGKKGKEEKKPKDSKKEKAGTSDENKRRLEIIQQYRWSSHVILISLLKSLYLVVFTVDELKPLGNYGVRDAALEGSVSRKALKTSILQYPIEVHVELAFF